MAGNETRGEPAGTRRPSAARERLLTTAWVSAGILSVLHTGIRREWLPQELGFGSGMTCWRRLRDPNRAGVWDRLHLAAGGVA
jgi:transposase